jgi:hypothetical protein
MQINYAGKISRDDFLQAIFLNSPQLKLQRWVVSILLVIMAFSFFYIWSLSSNSAVVESFPTLFPGFILLAVIGLFPWWVPYLQLSSLNQKGNIYRNNVFGLITDSGITVNNAEVNTSFQWSVFIDYRISKDLVMLYQSKNCFNLFVPSMFSDHVEWEKFVSFAKEKVSVNKKSA